MLRLIAPPPVIINSRRDRSLHKFRRSIALDLWKKGKEKRERERRKIMRDPPWFKITIGDKTVFRNERSSSLVFREGKRKIERAGGGREEGKGEMTRPLTKIVNVAKTKRLIEVIVQCSKGKKGSIPFDFCHLFSLSVPPLTGS